MDRKVAWTQVAWNDLEAVADHIARDSPYYTAAFAREVRDAARSLAHLAERGRVVPEFGELTVRELIVRRYRLIYRVTQQTIYIVGFIHGARDLLALWEQEGRPGSGDIS